MKQYLSGSRVWVVAAVAFLVLGVASYFGGVLSERAARTRDAQAAEQRYSALNAQFQGAQAQANARQSISELLSANVAICRATVALDNRNFGVADEAVRTAVANLDKVDAGAAGLEAQSLQAVRDAAAAVKISVATNLASLRNQLLRLAGDVDTLVVKSGPSVGAPSQ
jgi:hypothetical protein